MPPVRTKATGGLDPFEIPILTVNVQGIKNCVDEWNQKLTKLKKKGDERIVKKDEDENKVKKPPKDKGTLLLSWIDQNRNNIIILTETKLKDKKDSHTFLKAIKSATNDSFWTFCNFMGKSKHGVATLIPKKLFKKPSHRILEKGMVTQSLISSKQCTNFEFILISYYNPNVQKNPNLSEHILEKNIHQSKVIIAGDFNQSTNTSSDYKRINGRELEPSTIENKEKKAQSFNQLVKNCNLFFEEGNDLFTFERKTKDEHYLRRIDWIFYTKYFENDRNQFSTFETPFNTDHKAILTTLNIYLFIKNPFKH